MQIFNYIMIFFPRIVCYYFIDCNNFIFVIIIAVYIYDYIRTLLLYLIFTFFFK
jgi:hypothetical protein